jgi:hypothetical protein
MKSSLTYLFIILFCFAVKSQNTEKANQRYSDSFEAKSCLEKIVDPVKWYPKSLVAKYAHIPESEISMRIHKRSNTIQYQWKSDRTHMIIRDNEELMVPSKDVIVIAINNLDSMHFARSFQKKNIQQPSYSKLLGTYYINATMGDNDIPGDLITEAYSKLEEPGDEAHKYIQIERGIRDTRLVVLHRNVAILINVDVSSDDEEDLSMAKKVAHSIIGLCN